jgi:hypothetical protein
MLFTIGFTHDGKPTMLYFGESIKDAVLAENVALASKAWAYVRRYVDPIPTKIFDHESIL